MNTFTTASEFRKMYNETNPIENSTDWSLKDACSKIIEQYKEKCKFGYKYPDIEVSGLMGERYRTSDDLQMKRLRQICSCLGEKGYYVSWYWVGVPNQDSSHSSSNYFVHITAFKEEYDREHPKRSKFQICFAKFTRWLFNDVLGILTFSISLPFIIWGIIALITKF